MVDIENTTGEVTNEVVSEQAAAVQEQPLVNALDEFMAEADAESEATSTEEAEVGAQTEQTPQTEAVPKGIKGRIAAEVAKADKAAYERGRKEAYAEWERNKADYEAKIAAYEAEKLEATIKAEADALAKEEHISKLLAERIIRAEKGYYPAQQTSTPAQTEAAKNSSASSVEARAKELYEQAGTVQQKSGIDVLALIRTDETVRNKIGSGEWDCWDIAMYAMKDNSAPKAEAPKATPTPIRSTGNNDRASGYDFSTMSDEDFDKFEKRIGQGAVFKPR